VRSVTSLLVHDMDTAWTPSSASLVVAVEEQLVAGERVVVNHLVAAAGAAGASAELVLDPPLDLGGYDELRLRIRATRPADGSEARPFYLELSYTDAGDGTGDEHRWLVPIARSGTWEQRHFGIESDRRGQVDRFRLTCLEATPFECWVDRLLAVREEPVADLEGSLARALDGTIPLPELNSVGLLEDAAQGDTEIVVPPTPGFRAGNRVLLSGGTSSEERHDLAEAVHDPGGTPPRTTLRLDPADPVAGTFAADAGTVSLAVPVFVEVPPELRPPVSPALHVTSLGLREDLQRTASVPQRDSFRQRGAVTVCSVRPGARAYLADYQIVAVAPERRQQGAVYEMVLRRLSADTGLRVDGVPAPAPVWMLPTPPLTGVELGDLAPLYVRIGTRMQVAARREEVWVRRARVETGPVDAPQDREGIVVEL
jgi:hypothetical protein